MSRGAIAIILVVMVLLLHLKEVDMLSGSIEEFWRRRDENARISRLFFALSLLPCALVFLTPLFGVACAVAFVALHLGFSMREWKG